MSKAIHNDAKKEREVPLYLFHEGSNSHSYEYFGAHRKDEDTVVFRVWAPHARAVSVAGEFNGWDNGANQMYCIENSGGVWECEIKGVKQYDAYKYAVTAQDGRVLMKSDPYGVHMETRPCVCRSSGVLQY